MRIEWKINKNVMMIVFHSYLSENILNSELQMSIIPKDMPLIKANLPF